MSKRIGLIEIISTAILGTLLHFIYDWSGQNFIVGFLGAVNESTWEHLKLLFWPVAILSIFEFFFIYKNKNNFLFSRLIGLVCGFITILTLFYSVTGIVGQSVDVFNIALYYLAVLITFLISKIIMKNQIFNTPVFNTIAFIVLGLFAAAFIGFTYNPPALGIFADPQAK